MQKGLLAILVALSSVSLSCGLTDRATETKTTNNQAQLATSGTREEFVDKVKPLTETDVTDIDSKLQTLMPDLPSVDYGQEPVTVFDLLIQLKSETNGHNALWNAVFQTTTDASTMIRRLEENQIEGYSYVNTTEKSGEALGSKAAVTDVAITFTSNNDELKFVVKTDSITSKVQVSVSKKKLLTETQELADFMTTYSGWASDYPISADTTIKKLSISRSFQSFTLTVPPLVFSLELTSEEKKSSGMFADFEQGATEKGWLKTKTEDRDNFFTHPAGYEVNAKTDGPTLEVSTEVDFEETGKAGQQDR